jgi:hypothetical protein
VWIWTMMREWELLIYTMRHHFLQWNLIKFYLSWDLNQFILIYQFLYERDEVKERRNILLWVVLYKWWGKVWKKDMSFDLITSSQIHNDADWSFFYLYHLQYLYLISKKDLPKSSILLLVFDHFLYFPHLSISVSNLIIQKIEEKIS